MAIDMTLDAVLARHVPAASYGSERAICTYCEQDWPCEVAVVGADLARLRRIEAAAQAWAASSSRLDEQYLRHVLAQHNAG